MDEGTLIMCGIESEGILAALEVAIDHHSRSEGPFCIVPDYEALYVSQKVLRIALSYTKYVNRTVWSK